MTEGARYEETKGERTAQIAARIREDVKALGLPRGFKVSVRTDSSRTSNSIYVRVTRVPEGFRITSSRWIRWTRENPNAFPPPPGIGRATLDAAALLAKLEEICAQYGYDKSDIRTDYFNVRYYGDADFDWDLRKADEERDLEPFVCECEGCDRPARRPHAEGCDQRARGCYCSSLSEGRCDFCAGTRELVCGKCGGDLEESAIARGLAATNEYLCQTCAPDVEDGETRTTGDDVPAWEMPVEDEATMHAEYLAEEGRRRFKADADPPRALLAKRLATADQEYVFALIFAFLRAPEGEAEPLVKVMNGARRRLGIDDATWKRLLLRAERFHA